ncbi:TetR/AcrR family transcriptional regulator [Microbacterium sp. NIBRBAC000506063]|uniref:TetR/AcrR family transcriptional regulator n=1 Tax=Microbacterium sp. NIBRBAC000506063 TaxID=2734618 RepID=UPI001BB7B9AD|nr:TetR/AcrR family transcriptional regulator [Microbacterium sp. NIBRBAC000506063]QTV79795.1 helix-turn-helix transcriptional regulator [Microbacterium sp. NIBRBAC000506063]
MVDRRKQILAAARELAATGGLAAVSVRSVATRAGIGASTLRHYFPTQQELHDAVLGATFDANLRDLRIAETAVSAEDRLVECLWQFLPRAVRTNSPSPSGSPKSRPCCSPTPPQRSCMSGRCS